MRSRWHGALLVTFILSSNGASGQILGLGEGSTFEFELRYWRPNFGSELQVGGPLLSMVDDLGVQDEREFEYRGFLRFGRWVKVRGSGIKLDYTGTNALGREITFDGTTFPQDTTVETSMRIENIKGGVEVDIFALQEGFLSVVAEYSSFKAKPIALSSPEVDAEKVLDLALVTLGLKGRIYLTPGLALTAEASGMKKESSGVLTDFEGAITYNLSRNLGVSFGYRNLYAKWLKEGRATFRLEGYYFSGTIRF